MPRYLVSIIETRSHDYEVEAANADEAKDAAKRIYVDDSSRGEYLGGEVSDVQELE